MKCVHFITLMLCVCYTSSQYIAVNSQQPKSPCESSTQNSLIEHFFNIIFTEFHSTPPVCVCVQMCPGQSTYCYPNGCLNRDNLKRVDSPQATARAGNDRNQYMFIVDDKNDFPKDFMLSFTEESKTLLSPRDPVHVKRPEIFKDNLKYKKMHSVEIKNRMREQLRNIKSIQKFETADLSKTRWPMIRRNKASSRKTNSEIGRRALGMDNSNYFMTMLPSDDTALLSKYFKRDIAKTLNGDDASVKAFYLFDNSDSESNATETTMSLETLIDNLIKNRFRPKQDAALNETKSNAVAEDNMKNKTKVVTETTSDLLIKTKLSNDTVNLISINVKNDKLHNNKYTDDYVAPSTNKLNEMIKHLSKRIEKQNNTSIEIAKRVVGHFDDEDYNLITNTATLQNVITFPANSTKKLDDTTPVNQEIKLTTSADFKETMVTKKNRHRKVKSLHNSKSNSQ